MFTECACNTKISSESAEVFLGQSMCSQVSSLYSFENDERDNEMALII